MSKATIKAREVEYLVWGDNLSEMKHFCLDQCKITYETCHIDDYWSLEVEDDLKERPVVVPLGHYVVKLGDSRFIVLDPVDFKEFFQEINK